MNKKMRALLVVVVVLLIASAFPMFSSASHSWGGYHWARSSNPISLTLGDNVDSSWDAYLVQAAGDWNASSVLNVSVRAGFVAPRRCRPAAGNIEVCNYRYGQNGWLGLAQVWVSGGHITQGSAKMNDTYFSMAAYNTPAERAHVMCQEVGHDFGLGHQDESGISLGTCMDYAQDSTWSQHPNQHDYQMLESIYAHLDGSASTAAGPQSGSFEHPSEWGQLVSSNARSSTYVRDLGNGRRLITEVYWAYLNPEHRPHEHTADHH